MTAKEIIKLEESVLDMNIQLLHARYEINSISNSDRDFAGTLYINLTIMAQRSMKLSKDLQQHFDFA